MLISRSSQRLKEAAALIGNRKEEVSMGLGCWVCFQPLAAYVQTRIQQAAPLQSLPTVQKQSASM
jgi:hypothetical protein